MNSTFKNINHLLQMIAPSERLQCFIIVAMAIVTSFFEMVTAAGIVLLAQSLSQPAEALRYMSYLGVDQTTPSSYVAFYAACLCGGVYVVKNLFAAFEVYYQNKSIHNMSFNFKNKLLKKYTSSSYQNHLSKSTAYGLEVMDHGMDQVFASGMLPLASGISELIVIIALCCLTFLINTTLALSIIGISAVLIFLPAKLLVSKFYNWGRRLQDHYITTNKSLFEFLHSFKDVIILGKTENFIDRFSKASRQKTDVKILQNTFITIPRLLVEVTFMGIFVFCVWFVCINQAAPENIMATLSLYFYSGFRLMPGVNRLINYINSFKAAIPFIGRVHEEYQRASEEAVYENCPNLSFEKSIAFNSVCFQYANTDRQAISGINLTISKGENIGIVGETGSGKSTFIDMLLGLLPSKEGSILVDDKFPVHSYQWHQKIGYVPQSVYLTDDTIEANIAYGIKPENIDHKQLQFVIEAVQLKKFIEQQTDGVKTIVGERGVRLSGGERQRIAIARALYRNPEVLIFDEATSALDNKTEAKLMETINEVSQNRTVIMVAHRTTTLQSCDRIVIIDQGAISDITNYDSLPQIKKAAGKKKSA